MQTNSTPSTISSIQWRETISAVGKYDVIVAGGGISGVAAALSAARLGKSTLLLEKNTALGGLATIGLINFLGAPVQRPGQADHQGHGRGTAAAVDPLRL